MTNKERDQFKRLEAERARLERIVLEQQEKIKKLDSKLVRLGTSNIALNKRIGIYESRLLAASVILRRILDDGNYDDDGDFYLLHRGGPKPKPEDDYLEPEPIAQARALLRKIDA